MTVTQAVGIKQTMSVRWAYTLWNQKLYSSFTRPVLHPYNLRKMSTDHKFQGWLGLDKDSVKGKMVWKGYEPKPFEETDVDIKITHCGICGSDIHTLRSGWGATDYPVCKLLSLATETKVNPLSQVLVMRSWVMLFG